MREAQEENVLLFCIIFDAKSFIRFLVVVRSFYCGARIFTYNNRHKHTKTTNNYFVYLP